MRLVMARLAAMVGWFVVVIDMIKNGLKNLLPERYLEFMLSEAEIDSSNSLKQLTEAEKELIEREGLKVTVVSDINHVKTIL